MQARETDGSIRDGAWVIELTELIPLYGWPEDTRLIMRRERPHPGRPAHPLRHGRGVPPHLLHHQHRRRRHRRPRAPPPRPRPGRGPDPQLEGLRSGQPALRLLRPQRGLGGDLPHRRRTAGLEPDGLLRGCPGQGRAEDHALPGPPRRRPTSSTRGGGSSCAWTRPGPGPANWPPPSPNSGRPSPDEPGHSARPESRPAGRDIRNRMTTPECFTPVMSPEDCCARLPTSADVTLSTGGRTNDRG